MLRRVAAITSILMLGTAPARPSSTWPMYQGRPDHNAVFSGASVARNWQLHAGGKINGGLAIANRTLYAETFKHELLAVDMRNGRVRWRAHLANVAMTTPIVADGVVVIGTGTARVSTGQRRYVWGRPGGDAIEAFDTANGRLRWHYRTIGEDMPSPALVRSGKQNVIVFANGDDHVYALDVRTGRLLWRRPLQGISSMASAAARNGIVYVVAGLDASSHVPAHTYAVRSSNGAIVWHAPYGNADCSPVVGDGLVFVSSGDAIAGAPSRNAINIIYALDAKTGALRWSYKSPPGSFTNVGSNEQAIAGLVHDGVLYQSLEAAHRFAAFDARTGRLLWSIPTQGAVKMSAVIRDGKLYFGDDAGFFYTLAASNGHVIARRRFPRFFTVSSPILIGDTIFVANDTDILAFPAD
jgi:outer membrane protein assembly factor BamB